MPTLNNMYWELLNNEIRSIAISEEKKNIRIVTSFRTIQNVLEFKDVAWHQDLAKVDGCIINYIEQESEESLSLEEKSCLMKQYRENFSFEALAYEGLNLYQLICNKSKEKRMIIAGSIDILING